MTFWTLKISAIVMKFSRENEKYFENWRNFVKMVFRPTSKLKKSLIEPVKLKMIWSEPNKQIQNKFKANAKFFRSICKIIFQWITFQADLRPYLFSPWNNCMLNSVGTNERTREGGDWSASPVQMIKLDFQSKKRK